MVKAKTDDWADWLVKNPLRRYRINHPGKHPMTQVRIGAKLKVTPQIVRLWETGSGMPNKKNYAKLAKLLGMPEERLRAAWERWLLKCPA